MTKHQTTPNPAVKGGWLESQQRSLVDEFKAKLPKGASEEIKAELLTELAEKLKTLREWDRWNPRTMESVVRKENYREVGVLSGHTNSVSCLRALPDGRIVSASYDNTLRIWDGTPVDGGAP